MHVFHTSSRSRSVLVAFTILLISVNFVPALQSRSIYSSGTSNSPSKVLATKASTGLIDRTPATGKGEIPLRLGSSPPQVNWDEQLGLTFSQDRGSLEYNVTAVEQADSYGYGPAYILNGLTDKGDWYQVGLAYDWPLDGGGYASGFSFLYESFNTTGDSVFPSNGGGGLANYSAAIHEGDQVLLSLNLTGSLVVMYSHDWETGASDSVNYTSNGGAIFEGLQTANNQNGYFSGLMTEDYHVSPYLGPEAEVIYTNPNIGLDAGTMWIDEYNPSTNQTLFSGATGDLPYSNPNVLQYYTLNGTSEASDAYEFVTGSNVLIGMTLSYSVSGGGSSYEAPILNYVSNGTPENSTLTSTPTEYLMDQGTEWSVTNPLNGSTTSERWTSSLSNGTVNSIESLVLNYSHEFVLSFDISPVGGGAISPVTSGWYPAGDLNLTAVPKSPFLFSGWVTNSTGIRFDRFTSANTTAIIEGSGNITATFSTVAISLSAYSGTVTQGTSLSNLAEITGENQSVSLSVAGLPVGATAVLGSNQILDEPYGVSDNLTIETTYATLPGTYNLTVTASSSNGSSSVQFTLAIEVADPLTVSYSVNDGSAISPPEITYEYNGTMNQVTLSSTSQTLYVDNGSSWQISSTTNSSSTQRWLTLSPSQEIARGPATVQVQYYHQYLVAFISGSNGSSAATSMVSVVSQGISEMVQANGTQIWADSGSTYNYSNFVPVSSQERWEISGNQSGEVTEPAIYTANYVDQFLVNASYTTSGSSSSFPSGPVLTITGTNSSISKFTLTPSGNEYWITSGSTWESAANASGSSSERWIGSQTSGAITSNLAIQPKYYAQYLVSVSQNVAVAGQVSAVDGWHNASSSISISAASNSGWNFEQWTGTSVTNESSKTIEVNGPVNETAVFYAAVSITPASGGHVSYSYGSTSGTAPGGTTTTFYVPPGTNVSLGATSDSSFYSPGSWTTGNDSSSEPAGPLNLSIDSPTVVSVSFGLDTLLIALIVAIVAGVACSIGFIVLRRSGGRDYSEGSGHGWKW